MSLIPPIESPNMTDTIKTLNILRDGLISHDTRIQNMRDELNDIKKDVANLNEVVITGQVGELSHAERIRNLETYINGLRDTVKYWGRLIGGALLLNFLGFTTGILVAVIKFLPILEQLAKNPR